MKASTIAAGLGAAVGLAFLSSKKNAAPTYDGTVSPGTGQNIQEVTGQRTLKDATVQREWDDAFSELVDVAIPAWASRAVVTMRVQCQGRRLELNNSKTYFDRCGAWTFGGPTTPGVVLQTANLPSLGGFVPVAIFQCGDGQDDWAEQRAWYGAPAQQANEIYRAALAALPAPGTPWWLRARARISVDRRLVVELIYPRNVPGASNKDGGQFRGNKYDVALDYVLAR